LGIEHNSGQKAERTGKGKCTFEAPGSRSIQGQRNPKGGALKKVISPERRHQAVDHLQSVMDVSERRVYWVLEQPRSTQRYKKRITDNEEILTSRIVALTSE